MNLIRAIGIALIVIGCLFYQATQPANAPPAPNCKLKTTSGVQWWKCPVKAAGLHAPPTMVNPVPRNQMRMVSSFTAGTLQVVRVL